MIKNLTPRSNYAKNVLTLMTGTGLAQAIPIVASPFLTRLYTPESFGVYAFYFAIVAILVIPATGRYELAILLPKRQSGAMQVVALSIALGLFVSSLLLLSIIFLSRYLSTWSKLSVLSGWLYFIPVSTFLLCTYQALNYWNNRQARYKKLALSRVSQTGVSTAAQVVMGSVKTGMGGLIFGQFLGQVVASFVLLRQMLKDDKKYIRQISRVRVGVYAKKYINFPKYMVIGQTFNAASSQIPVLLLSAFFSASSAGLYSLAERLVGVPTSLIAGAIGDVFREEASRAYIHNGNCREIFISTFKRLALIAIGPSIAICLLAPLIFETVFGQQWREAGVYAQILTPMFFLRFSTSPLSIMFMISERQRIDLVWQVFLLLTTTVSFLVGNIQNSIRVGLIMYSVCYSIMYLVNLAITYRLTIRQF